ncbi:MAG: acyl-CoA dehydrogenase family protein [Xenococcaceae cyanobacterium]
MSFKDLTDEQQRLLEVAETYFRSVVAPQAAIIDQEPEALRKALRGMGDRSLLALRVPKLWGGSEFSEIAFRRFQIMMARYSGALTFLQAQHQSAGSLLVVSTNKSLKQEYLPRMARSEVLVGVGFSQLRRRGEPPMKAVPVAGGYQLEGEVPWITGFGFFQDFIIGAALPNGEAVYGMVPFRDTAQESGGTIRLSQPMELAAMASTNTVSASLSGWFLPSDRVLAVKPGGSIHENDKKNVLHHGFFALGCAQAGLDILETAYQRKQLPFLRQAFDSLNQELTSCRTQMFEALPPQSQSFEQRLQLRTWAINLAGRCSQAAVTVSGGAANYKYHAAQRVYREALMFTVSGQTTAVMEATLELLLFVGKLYYN